MQQVNSNRWKKEEIEYIKASYGAIPLETMAKRLGKTVNAVRLFALRHRLDSNHQLIKENRFKKLLEHRFRHLEDFTPSRYFYQETGINQVRYGDLFYGRKSITPKEYKAVAAYFNITIAEAFDSLQLELFGNE